MRRVTHYDKGVHEVALRTAKAILADVTMPYNERRQRLQAAATPIIAAEFGIGDVQSIWNASEWAPSVTFTPRVSNMIQRMNVNTLSWIIATHKDGGEWPKAIQEAGRSRAGAASIFNPNYSAAEIKAATNIIITTATGEAAPMTTINETPALNTIVAILDNTLISGDANFAEVQKNFLKLYPDAAGPLGAAMSLRKLAPGKQPIPAGYEEIVASIISGDVKEAPAGTIKSIPTETAAIIDGVLSTLGVKPINDLIRSANAATKAVEDSQKEKAALEAEVADWKKKASSRPVMATVSVAASGAIPAGKVETRKAYDVFEVTDAKRKKLLDFEVPFGTWFDDKGLAAVHPYVPEKMDDFIFSFSTLVPILLSIVGNQKPWLRGHTGTGKTTVIEQVYARLNLPLYRVNLDSDISRGELVGRETIKHDPATGATTTQFVEGIIPRSMQEPCGLLLDEVDASRPDLTFVLQRLTEGKGFMLLEDGGRTINAHPWFRLFATANTNGRGDETGLYTGTRVLGSAFVNRFGPFLLVDYIDQKSETALLKARAPGLDPSLVEQIVGYAREARVAFTQGQVTLPCSPRDTLGLAQTMMAYLGVFPTPQEAVKLAFDHVIFNAADGDDVVILKGLADRFIKSALTSAKAA